MIPIFAQAMRRGGVVPVDRKRRGRSRIDRPLKELFQKTGWVYMAPEGTRSPDENLLPFRSGPFWVADKFKVPIVIVGIKGARDVMPKHSYWFRTGKSVSATVLTILRPDGNADVLKEKTRRILQDFKDRPS